MKNSPKYLAPDYHKKRKAEWHKNRREVNLLRMADWRRSVWAAAIGELGGACKCCGEQRVSMLEMDHINSDGSKHRRSTGGNNFRTYMEARTDPDRAMKYQVLCANCNGSKRRNGVCEHIEDASDVAMATCP